MLFPWFAGSLTAKRVPGFNPLAEGKRALLRLVDVAAGRLHGGLAVALAAVDRRESRCRGVITI